MRYRNPVIAGFNPDPAICRNGKDFCLVTSSFEYFPGVPIYHSTNLADWTLEGYCLKEAVCISRGCGGRNVLYLTDQI